MVIGQLVRTKRRTRAGAGLAKGSGTAARMLDAARRMAKLMGLICVQVSEVCGARQAIDIES